MPDKPTDKLTFVEWHARENYGGNVKFTKGTLHSFILNIIREGIHNKDCTDKNYFCTLCELEKWLTEYHKYFKKK